MPPPDPSQIIPVGLCQCGCGQKTTVQRRTSKSGGYAVGVPCRFRPGHSARMRVSLPPEQRTCKKCGRGWPDVRFRLKRIVCMVCENAEVRERYHRDGGARARQWRNKNLPKYREKRREYSRRYFRKNPGYYTSLQRRRLYGVEEDDVRGLLDRQSGKCAICGRDISLQMCAPNPAHLDHDHKTGHVRGMLCSPCNTGLGQFQDDPLLLREAIEYLDRHVRDGAAIPRKAFVDRRLFGARRPNATP